MGRAYASAIYIRTMLAEWIFPDIKQGELKKERYGPAGEKCDISNVDLQLCATLAKLMQDDV